jgi:hypothetical protein
MFLIVFVFVEEDLHTSKHHYREKKKRRRLVSLALTPGDRHPVRAASHTCAWRTAGSRRESERSENGGEYHQPRKEKMLFQIYPAHLKESSADKSLRVLLGIRETRALRLASRKLSREMASWHAHHSPRWLLPQCDPLSGVHGVGRLTTLAQLSSKSCV